MDHRLGKCSDCGAEYKIPASFPHDVARCKVCPGTVRLGQPGGSAPAEAPKAMPARKVAPTSASSASEEAPKKKKKGDTLARLKAQRQAAEAPAPAKKAAAPKAAAKAKPAAKAAAPAKPARSAGASTRRRASAKDDEGGGKSSRRPRREAKPKKTPVGGLIGLGVLAVLVAGIFFFKDSLFGDKAVAAEDSNTEVAADTNTEEGTEAATDPTEEAGTEDPAEDAAVDTPEDDTAADPTEEADTTPKEKPTPQLSDIDLSEFNFSADTGVSDDEWQEMNGWMATWMDVDAGAAGNRSKLKLLAKKRAAVPVILNYMKTLDFTTEEGKSNGDQCQKGLTEILNGANFSWKYSTSEEDAYFNKGVVRNFCLIWEKASDNLEYWIKTAKLEERDPEEADRLRELFGIDGASGGESAPPVFEDDDLDVD